MKSTVQPPPPLLLAGVIALAAFTFFPGCAAVVVGTGAVATYAYVRGDLDTTLEASLDKSVTATNKAIEQLRFAKVSQKDDALQAVIITRNAADKKIEIKLEKTSENVSKVKIRVGTFGDEQLSIAVLEKIKANL